MIYHCDRDYDANAIKVTASLPIDIYGNVVVVKQRLDSINTSDTKLKSALSAALKSP